LQIVGKIWNIAWKGWTKIKQEKRNRVILKKYGIGKDG